MTAFENIPDILLNFVITLLLSLLIGLEQRKLGEKEDNTLAPAFGTDRTFTFIGILGFILFLLDEKGMVPFTAGALVLVILLGIYYFNKIQLTKSFGLTSIIAAFITYSLGPVVITQPRWLTILIAVSVLILTERKSYFIRISKRININEFTTLAKFLIIAGVVLPIVPKDPPIPIIGISPYDIWFTIVIVSAISYVGYLLQKYIFHKSGALVSGILGGLYSSTALTVILGRRSKETDSGTNIFAASIVGATAMMYLRILILMLIFNMALAQKLLPYLGALIVASLAAGAVIYFFKHPKDHVPEAVENEDTNPLELKIAAVFAVLFVFFSFITHYTIQQYGGLGLNVLSYLVGFTDIDPFLLNLFQGKYTIGIDAVGKAALQAIISNNILKSLYIYVLADKRTKKLAISGLAVITILNIIFAILM